MSSSITKTQMTDYWGPARLIKRRQQFIHLMKRHMKSLTVPLANNVSTMNNNSCLSIIIS